MAHLSQITNLLHLVTLLISFMAFVSSALAQRDPSSHLINDGSQLDAPFPRSIVVPQPEAAYTTLPKNYDGVRAAHAVFACVAWLIFFPLGGILVRVLETSNAVWIHAALQGIGSVLFVVGAGCGIWMARTNDVIEQYHPILGLSLLAALLVQPATELINHFLYHRHPKVITAAHVHLWFGRLLITVGILQGGLGFVFSASLSTAKQDNWPRVLYGIVATIVWILYMAGAVIWPMVRHTFPSWVARGQAREAEEMQESTRQN